MQSSLKKIISRSVTLIACFFLLLNEGNAQQTSRGFSREVLSPQEKMLNAKNVYVHSHIQPAASGLDTSFHHTDSLQRSKPERNSSLTIQPVSRLQGGWQVADSSSEVYNGFAGLDFSWNHKNKWFAEGGYSLCGGRFPDYIGRMASDLRFLPGQGFAVADDQGVAHSHYTWGRLSYNEGKHFHFELGKGKNFFGDGYRSMILSDNAGPYPYARITTRVWKLQYTNLWMQFRDLSYTNQISSARLKYAAMHALSLNASKKFNITLYEFVVWQDRDTMSKRSLDINYLNPIIFYRPVEYAQGSPDNVILALSMKLRFRPRVQFYGQFILDEFNLAQLRTRKKWWGNKLGGQFGVKLFDLFPNFSWQMEGNIARPFLYSHGSPVQAWTQINQPLAHPLGANFMEVVNFFRYDGKAWRITEQFNWSAYGRDADMNGDGSMDNMGGNILRSYRDPYNGPYNHEFLQGLRSTLFFHSLTIYMRLPKAPGWELFLNHSLRYEENQIFTQRDHFVQAGIRKTGILEPQSDY